MKLIKVRKGDDAKSVKEVEKELNDVALKISDAAQKLRTIKFAENFLTPEERKYIVSVIMGSRKEFTKATEAYEQLVNDVKKWDMK